MTKSLDRRNKLSVPLGRPKTMAERIAEQQAVIRNESQRKPHLTIAEHEAVALLLDDSSSMGYAASARCGI